MNLIRLEKVADHVKFHISARKTKLGGVCYKYNLEHTATILLNHSDLYIDQTLTPSTYDNNIQNNGYYSLGWEFRARYISFFKWSPGL